MTPPASDRIVQEDPLEGGGIWFWIAGVLLALAAGGAVYASRLTSAALHDSSVVPLLGFTAPLGMASLVFAGYLSFRFRKFGHATLDAAMPVPGTAWTGVVRTGTDVVATGDFVLTLTCERHESRSTSQGSSAIYWEAACRVPHAGVRSSAGIPFTFAPPAGVRIPSGAAWWLEVRAPTTGLDFRTLFEVTAVLGRRGRARAWGTPARPASE